MQPRHGAPSHQPAADPSHSTVQYFGIPGAAPCRHVQPYCWHHPVHFMGSPLHPQTLYGQFAQPPTMAGYSSSTQMQFQGAEPEQKRELNEAYCLLDKEGSQLSGRSYEGMISMIFQSGGAWTLRAVDLQKEEERERLETSRNAMAQFLQKVCYDAGNAMKKKGVAEEQAEVDTVYDGSFKAFAESMSKLSSVIVRATCEKVEKVLVEICSDSRFVAMKLYQIEIQSCLVARSGFLVDEAGNRQSLPSEHTGFGIIFNRAALRIDPGWFAKEFDLTNVQNLLAESKLHIAYFQPESAVPAALSIAKDAEKKAADADKKAADAINELRELKNKLQGTTAALTKAVWVRQLQKKDGSGGFEFVGNAFQVKDKDMQNIDDLKKAIKKEKPNKVQCDADEIDIFSQEDGKWRKEGKMSAPLHDNDEDAPYGYIVQ